MKQPPGYILSQPSHMCSLEILVFTHACNLDIVDKDSWSKAEQDRLAMPPPTPAQQLSDGGAVKEEGTGKTKAHFFC